MKLKMNANRAIGAFGKPPEIYTVNKVISEGGFRRGELAIISANAIPKSFYADDGSGVFQEDYMQALEARKAIKRKVTALMANAHFKNIVKRHNLRNR